MGFVQFKRAFALVVLVLLSASCLEKPFEAHEEESHTKYLTFGSFRSCTLAKARNPVVNICIKNGDAAQVEKAKKYSKRAILTWFRAMRMIDDKVVGNIQFSCSSSDLTINLRSGSGTSFAGCGNTTIYSAKPYGTTLHEFGHAVVGLGDTYSGRQAGNCRSGQPKSAMCWGAYGKKDSDGFNMLYPDDVEGVHANYRTIFKDLTPPESAIDPFALLDPDNPWPSATGGNGGGNVADAGGLFARIGESVSAADKTFEVFVSAPKNDVAVFACIGDKDNSCVDDVATRIDAKEVSVVGARKIYKLSAPVAMVDGGTVSLFSSKNGAAGLEWSSKQKIKFTPK